VVAHYHLDVWFPHQKSFSISDWALKDIGLTGSEIEKLPGCSRSCPAELWPADVARASGEAGCNEIRTHLVEVNVSVNWTLKLCALFVRTAAPDRLPPMRPRSTSAICAARTWSQPCHWSQAPANNDGIAGARLAIDDNNTTGKFLDQQFSLEDVRLAGGTDAFRRLQWSYPIWPL